MLDCPRLRSHRCFVKSGVGCCEQPRAIADSLAQRRPLLGRLKGSRKEYRPLSSSVDSQLGHPSFRDDLFQIHLPGYSEPIVEPGKPAAKTVVAFRHEITSGRECIADAVELFFRRTGYKQ